MARSTNLHQGADTCLTPQGGGRYLHPTSNPNMTMEGQWNDGWSSGDDEIGETCYARTPYRSLKRDSRGFLPQAQTISSLQIHSNKGREKVELWKENALIGKCIGIWMKERDMVMCKLNPIFRTITLTTIANYTCKLLTKGDWIWSKTLICIE